MNDTTQTGMFFFSLFRSTLFKDGIFFFAVHFQCFRFRVKAVTHHNQVTRQQRKDRLQLRDLRLTAAAKPGYLFIYSTVGVGQKRD